MIAENNQFIYTGSFDELYHKINNITPSTLLISEKFIQFDSFNILELLSKIPVKWIIIIGNNSSNAEDDLDFLIETSLDDNLLDVVTTSFSYEEIDDIAFEFLVTSKLGFKDYQFLSVLDFDKVEEVMILRKINKNIMENFEIYTQNDRRINF